MSSFNVSEYNSYILINSENTSSGKWHTLVNNASLRKPHWVHDKMFGGFVMPIQKLHICKGSPRGPEYLNYLVFDLTLNYFLYQTPSISKVTNEKTEYCHFTELRKTWIPHFHKTFFSLERSGRSSDPLNRAWSLYIKKTILNHKPSSWGFDGTPPPKKKTLTKQNIQSAGNGFKKHNLIPFSKKNPGAVAASLT